ncbi:DinB family protein [Dinghuibacter silviterrae]|uniref:DinB family protein n=1 Tax=Dinghuibacter silviterrae TaxID=1539049 RepID=A0A4R8DV48_9BACT|nr:DinB family protein [Dinghuibacter silviterrae]TDX02059.1 DinB family protein [Dinghuibacter silviterrae]
MPTHLIKAFNDTISQWIEALDHYTPGMLVYAPAPGSWSIGQVYTHLIDDTGFFVTQMKAALVTDQQGAMHEDGQRMFARGGFPDVLIEGPATGKVLPQPEHPRQALLAIREEVNRLDFTRPSGKTRHPGLGYFSALEWLQFAEMHLRHHLRQKARIDAAIAAGYTKL